MNAITKPPMKDVDACDPREASSVEVIKREGSTFGYILRWNDGVEQFMPHCEFCKANW